MEQTSADCDLTRQIVCLEILSVYLPIKGAHTMVVFVCGCLNMRIFAEAIKHQDVNRNSPLGSKVVEIELTDPGFDFKYGFLVKRDTFAGWTTFSCLNCKKKTHSINRELKTIVVCKDLECGDEVLARLSRSKEFSPIFHIVLPSKDLIGNIPELNTQTFESLQAQLADVQRDLDNYLLKQEAIVEERIRRFEEEQREKLAQIRTQAQEDKKKMISLILQHAELIGQTGRVTKSRTNLTKAKSVFDDSPNAVHQSSQPMAIERTSPLQKFESDFDENELFALDGLDGDENYHSNSEDDDDVPAVTIGIRGSANKCSSIYSASVPVNIPMGGWTNQIRRDVTPDFDSDEEKHLLDPEQIASNMQALAESIPDNKRYIFGDRPRPRLNTNNF